MSSKISYGNIRTSPLITHVHDKSCIFTSMSTWIKSEILTCGRYKGMLQEAQMYLTCQTWREWILILEEPLIPPLCPYSSSSTNLLWKHCLYRQNLIFLTHCGSNGPAVSTSSLPSCSLMYDILEYVNIWH